MMERYEFLSILRWYGQAVTVVSEGSTEERTGRAIVQPILENGQKSEQVLPTSLGLKRLDRFLYLGEPGLSLKGIGDGYILCDGVKYAVKTAQTICVGNACSHWWAILTVRNEDIL